MHCDDDSAFLFEPLPDARQALPIGNRGLDLGPKGSNLSSFRRGFFPAPLCEPVSGFGNPLLLRFRVFFALGHLFDSLRLISTYFNIFRQFTTSSTIFDVFRQREARRDPPRPVRRPKTLVVEHKVGMRYWVSWRSFLLLQLWLGRDALRSTCIPSGMRLQSCDYLRPKSPSPSPYR